MASLVQKHSEIDIYALVGGPSTGKTSIIEALFKTGESVIPEAASDIILNRLAAGIKRPWEEEDFIYRIIQLQLVRENEALNKTSNKKRIFVDRGILDAVGYMDYLKRRGTLEEAKVKRLLEDTQVAGRYKSVFFILPHAGKNFSLEQTAIRHEESKDVAHLNTSIYNLYSSYGYKPVEVAGEKPPAERAAWILSKLQLG